MNGNQNLFTTSLFLSGAFHLLPLKVCQESYSGRAEDDKEERSTDEKKILVTMP